MPDWPRRARTSLAFAARLTEEFTRRDDELARVRHALQEREALAGVMGAIMQQLGAMAAAQQQQQRPSGAHLAVEGLWFQPPGGWVGGQGGVGRSERRGGRAPSRDHPPPPPHPPHPHPTHTVQAPPPPCCVMCVWSCLTTSWASCLAAAAAARRRCSRHACGRGLHACLPA